MYHPFSVLSVLDNQHFKNYWFQTGTPTFLVHLLKQYPYRVEDLDGIKVQEEDIETLEIEKLPLVTLLFQTGYLTIKQYDKQT